MKLSEAMRQGKLPGCSKAWIKWDQRTGKITEACPLVNALTAVVDQEQWQEIASQAVQLGSFLPFFPEPLEDALRLVWPDIVSLSPFSGCRICKHDYELRTLEEAIMHLSDEHSLDRFEIADLLEGYNL